MILSRSAPTKAGTKDSSSPAIFFSHVETDGPIEVQINGPARRRTLLRLRFLVEFQVPIF